MDDNQMMLYFARGISRRGALRRSARDAKTALRVLDDDRVIRAVITDLRPGKRPEAADPVRQALAMRPDIRGGQAARAWPDPRWPDPH